MKHKQILNYVIYDSIEEGTYGKVYNAKNLLTGEECAIKVFFDKGNIIDLRHEYNILSSLDHENIIQCKGYFEQVNKVYMKNGYLVMEKGRTDLYEHLCKNLNIIEFINYIYDVIKGLEYLHSKQIVHGDIKLENVVLVGNRAKIVDFGLSHRLQETVKNISYQGTKNMIAPEILFDGFCCCNSDVWSLGKMMQQIEQELMQDGYKDYPRMSCIFMKCFERDYRIRPNITKIKDMFEERYGDILSDIHT